MKSFFSKFIKKENSEKGVSLIVLVITIVVVIMIAAIAISSHRGSLDASVLAEYRNELKGVEVDVATARIRNQTQGITEEEKEDGFYKVFVENPPANFVSFGSGEYYGYVVDLNKINSDKKVKKGREYLTYKVADGEEAKEITFGKSGNHNDVYIYDAIGKVYYAKGLYVDEGVYYSDELTEDGPRINIDKQLITGEDGFVSMVRLDIHVVPEIEGEPIVLRVDNMAQTEHGQNTFEYTTNHNGTFRVVAEEYSRVAVKNVHVTEISEKRYTITYHLLDETNTVETQEKPASASVRLRGFKRDGYVQVGWSKNPSGTTKDYLPGAPFNENLDIDLYAIWEMGVPKEYQITFNANGGVGAPDPITKLENVDALIPGTTPSRQGYRFGGWCTSSKADHIDYIMFDSYTENKDMMLYAVWTDVNGTIIHSFNSEFLSVMLSASPEGAGTLAGGGLYDSGSMVHITASPKKGYQFAGWVVTEGNAKLNNARAEGTYFTMPNMSVSITANFEESDHDYTIKYDARGGSGTPSTQYKKHGTNINLSSQTPTKSGQVFKGWADTAASVTEKYQPGDVYSDNKSVTLYAIWANSDTKCTITFDANGGINPPKPITKPAGTVISIPAQEPTRGDQPFLGWDTEIHTQSPRIHKNDQYTLNRDVTVFAQYKDDDEPFLKITADEDEQEHRLVLHGEAEDIGGIVAYLWTKQEYRESAYSSIPWVNLEQENTKISIENRVLSEGYHHFYVKDKSGNVSHGSIEVYKMEFRGHDGIVVDTRYKASGYAASLSPVIPKRALYVFDRWKGQSNQHVYERTDVYNINADEVFDATWILATAWIPAQNEYFLSANDAARTIPSGESDYELIQLLLDDPTPLIIEEGQKISLDTSTKKMNVTGNAVTVANGAYFRFVKGVIEASEYGIRNTGTSELLEGTIKGRYGISNAGTVTLGDRSTTYDKNSIKVEATNYSYVKAATSAILELENGSLIDAVSFVNSSSITPRTGFVYRAFESNGLKVTTITEQINVTNTVIAGASNKPVERKVTFTSEITSRDSSSVIEFSENNSTWTAGTEVAEIIDNKTIYIRTRDADGVAATTQVKIDDISELKITFDAMGGTSNPTYINVKYKRPYNYYRAWPKPNRQYYDFQGWFTTETGDTVVESGDTVLVTEDQTLYAHWRGIELTVTFDKKGGATMTPNETTKTVHYMEPYGDLPTVSSGELWQWDGWHLSSTHITSSSTVTTPTNHTLVSKWTLLNRPPVIVTDSFYDKGVYSFSVRVKATDPDNDPLTYNLYVDGSRKDYTTGVSSGGERTLTASYLSEYTTYSWYVTVTDNKPSGTVTGSTHSTKTKCSGGYSTTESYTCYGDDYYCSGGEPHYNYSSCTSCGGDGTKTCNGGSWVEMTSGQVNQKCSACGNNTYNTYRTYHCQVCGADGWALAGCFTGGCSNNHTSEPNQSSSIHPKDYDCPDCDGGQTKTLSYTSPCSHGNTSSHYYCSHGYTSSHTAERSKWVSCSHGNYTGPHE